MPGRISAGAVPRNRGEIVRQARKGEPVGQPVLLAFAQFRAGDTIEALEVEAVDGAAIYDDVLPALAELKAMGVQLFIASSLSHAAVARFLDECCPHELSTAFGAETMREASKPRR